jgi:hypothetical protein
MLMEVMHRPTGKLIGTSHETADSEKVFGNTLRNACVARGQDRRSFC